MLFVYDAGEKLPITDQTEFYITHKDGGLDTLNFSLLVSLPIYKHIAEENRIEYRDNYYTIKSINAPGNTAKIGCSIDLDFLKESFYKAYDSGSVTLPALLETVLPNGWTIQGFDPGISRTVQLEDATDYDVVLQAANTYGVKFKWETVNKKLTVIDPTDVTPSGEYLTDELNLRSIAFKGESTKLVTRLYPYGKDGLTVSSVNGGVEYIENHQYSSKTISAYWKDDRYTDPSSLLADAIEKLKSLSAPVRSYECDVVDLAKFDVKYAKFTFALYKVVTLIDRARKVRMNHQILEYKEYPEQAQKNVLTLSSVVGKIQTKVDQAVSKLQDSVVKNAGVMVQLSDLFANSMGYYHTDQIDEAGRTISYVHDKLLLSESSTVWKISIDGFAVSTDGGQTWSGGFTASTNLIAKIVSTTRVQSTVNPRVYFDLIQGIIAASLLVASDDSGITANVGREDPEFGTAIGLFINFVVNGVTKKIVQFYKANNSDPSLSHGAQIWTPGNLELICGAAIGNGVANWLGMYKDANNNGSALIDRAKTGGGSERVFYAGSDESYLQHMGSYVSAKGSVLDFGVSSQSVGYMDANGWHGPVNGSINGYSPTTYVNAHVRAANGQEMVFTIAANQVTGVALI